MDLRLELQPLLFGDLLREGAVKAVKSFAGHGEFAVPLAAGSEDFPAGPSGATSTVLTVVRTFLRRWTDPQFFRQPTARFSATLHKFPAVLQPGLADSLDGGLYVRRHSDQRSPLRYTIRFPEIERQISPKRNLATFVSDETGLIYGENVLFQ